MRYILDDPRTARTEKSSRCMRSRGRYMTRHRRAPSAAPSAEFRASRGRRLRRAVGVAPGHRQRNRNGVSRLMSFAGGPTGTTPRRSARATGSSCTPTISMLPRRGTRSARRTRGARTRRALSPVHLRRAPSPCTGWVYEISMPACRRRNCGHTSRNAAPCPEVTTPIVSEFRQRPLAARIEQPFLLQRVVAGHTLSNSASRPARSIPPR